MSDGFINLNKPSGMTSHDAVNHVRRIFSTRKVGHAGTLDPQASGVLPIAVNRATKFIEYLTDSDKSYRAEILFGIATDSGDLEGEIIEVEKESQSRVKAVCPLSKVCGSCDWLCVSYDEQLKQKQQLIEEALKREGISVNVDGIIPSPKQTEYRCKIQLPYGMTKIF